MPKRPKIKAPGLFSKLTPEQKAAALAYAGPVLHLEYCAVDDRNQDDGAGGHN